MEKPIVFLSHSSKNKRELNTLKRLLDRRAAGFLNFFLSSDGESIRLGTNWSERLIEALRKTKLMFVFVSEEALKSEWLLFEAGHAFGREKIHVVPYTLPGTELDKLPAPLKLLQAHKLHCAKDLSTLVRKCNEVFSCSIPDRFTVDEFNKVFHQLEMPEERVEPSAWESLLSTIEVQVEGPPHGADAFRTLCRRKGLDEFGEIREEAKRNKITSAGVSLCEENEWWDERERKHVEGGTRHRYSFTFAPELFGMTSRLFDSWLRKMKIKESIDIEAVFACGVNVERPSHVLTTKLFGSEIHVFLEDYFGFRNLRFSLLRYIQTIPPSTHPHLTISGVRQLADTPLPELLLELVKRRVLLLEKGYLEEKFFPKKRRS